MSALCIENYDVNCRACKAMQVNFVKENIGNCW
jgi:hypothetical protein